MHTQEKHIQSPGKAIVANSASLPSFSHCVLHVHIRASCHDHSASITHKCNFLLSDVIVY